ncbi:MAG: tRNA (adenosine(37)-N6)-dimethylallyltransferase MiaA, partial [Clostridia bacterium]|nr:tRNA (adenosine(37)-N6)-dimethylallyltransferase MiaA [Clostridia bacterium]
KVIVIFGPTASGKTSLSLRIAKELGGEIISADSMQIYKKLDIGTAKATKEEQAEITHHLIDICDINESFNVYDYKKLCYEKIEEILSRGKVPIIVGGTGLYLNAVINNMKFDEENVIKKDSKKEEQIKNEIEGLLETKGKEYVYSLLAKEDKEAAKKIHVNNVKRVVRALIIARSGNKKSETDRINDLWDRQKSPYEFIKIYIDVPREILYDRINQRVDEMIKSGIIEEARYVKNLNLNIENTALQAIGYKEFFKYIDSEETLEEAVLKLKQATRNYAKRQITWFKKLGNDYTVDINNLNDCIFGNIRRDTHGEK